ncbi:Putative hydrolase of the HD superfamily (permuted catalytic motifs) [Gloeomargarita lithophora Alchichica-D10]|uniref:Hydrolase of the HD superfamily (Permuted catalytic motifs) n=1 Tax=Gloeomargarita lithophora Alchichica-D10 TaxID=1188229 RepID=A0A1J0A976_9CYAN|nr:type III-B CRISPR-associated protein Cas10/Cmr2 [Gloeomargarita lithophora]APB32483.1 Putative hydrolase of the HD superfamily (permuted catalytic motifs) [Gloeomargarita lithophora Alchichica-D10]
MYFARKLFALLHDPPLKSLLKNKGVQGSWTQVNELYRFEAELISWWDTTGEISDHIASASDRFTFRRGIQLDAQIMDASTQIEIRHPISGQSQIIKLWNTFTDHYAEEIGNRNIWDEMRRETDLEKVFWWFWRFYPESIARDQAIQTTAALNLPADTRIPDCSIHIHNCTVSALTGAMFPHHWQVGQPPERPYLLLFSFSPVQEFIKSSRKFLDFWSGSYLLHYLSVNLCWFIAEKYGPDAVITPSLWGQEIVDAFILKKYPEFETFFNDISKRNPVQEFIDKTSASLSTAGFPNMITILVPGAEEAKQLGQELAEHLKNEWQQIGEKIKRAIHQEVQRKLSEKPEIIWEKVWQEMTLNDASQDLYRREFDQWWRPECNWEWNKLWDAQLDHTWETYWVALPLGNPEQPFTSQRLTQKEHQQITKNPELQLQQTEYEQWITAQQILAQNRLPLPTELEAKVYTTINVGTWWGSFQARLGQCLQAIKNTRTWQIPVAPGERSTISGMYSAVHPKFSYCDQFKEGGGLPAGSMRLFWLVMAEVFPGLFNGSEHLNAIELTKRMAWKYGGIATSLGIELGEDDDENYENLVRFPNLSSIACARFAHDHPEIVKRYWHSLNQSVQQELSEYHSRFRSLTRRPFHISKVNQTLPDYNGVMFSSKWLADDMGLQTDSDITTLKESIDQAHKNCGITNGSPSDWWCLVLADGDNMGKYVNGRKLKPYGDYIPESVKEKIKSLNEKALENARKSDNQLDISKWESIEKSWEELFNDPHTKKRMGPATHIGLNRALLDFSNRIVPYLTEQRFCGKVIYSGGDDVMAALPLEDLPEYLLTLRAAWSGAADPKAEFKNAGGYWHPQQELTGIPDRALFTMGQDATMSIGVIIAHKSVPLPTVLESIWTAEKERAKKLPAKDGLCFRVIYSSGNTLEALIKGDLLKKWWQWLQRGAELDLAPVLYRLSEELPLRCSVTKNDKLFALVTRTILARRERKDQFQDILEPLENWLNDWEKWAFEHQNQLGSTPDDLAKILRLSAFWVDKMHQRQSWVKDNQLDQNLAA